MRDAISAIEAALRELVEARQTLPDDMGAEIDRVITQTKILLDSLTAAEPSGSVSASPEPRVSASPEQGNQPAPD